MFSGLSLHDLSEAFRKCHGSELDLAHLRLKSMDDVIYKMADVLEIKQKANGLIVYRKLAMDREQVAKPQGWFKALRNSKYTVLLQETLRQGWVSDCP